MISFSKVGIIGLGLIGGSLAKALRKRCGIQTIVAYNRHDDVLKAAKAEGVIDDYTTKINGVFSGCDLIFICTPVHTIVPLAKELLPYIPKDCVLTDVGSTKGHICHQMDDISQLSFIGGHPMTGSERFRYSASKEHLFENAYYIVTPGKNATENQTWQFTEIIKQIGAIPVVLSPQEHDSIVAAVSHVPHIIASGLVTMVQKEDSPQGYMHQLAAGGFKDITRIASSSPDMWESICMENKGHILPMLDAFEKVISDIREKIVNSNQQQVFSFFDNARQYRDSFINMTPGQFVKRFEISVEILDRPGSIAIIAVVFSAHNIKIGRAHV